MMQILRALAFVIAARAGGDVPRRAQDKIKVAIGQIDAWANQIPTLGMQAGIFQKHGIELENFGTQGAGETLQAVISGSADIGIGIGTSGAMRAFVRGAPIRVIAAAYAGTGDQYWYVQAGVAAQERSRTRPKTRRCRIRPTARPRTPSRWRSASSSASRRSRSRPAGRPRPTR